MLIKKKTHRQLFSFKNRYPSDSITRIIHMSYRFYKLLPPYSFSFRRYITSTNDSVRRYDPIEIWLSGD